ncbi:6-phospho-beta-glucosidase [Metabacillus halosaccharovorans]|uniref:6-phospho-beta-glucosidase n=1 Tax=Metabacillus halosaccharovorans TaxID=930124 RepID=A0ABT3DBL9_9BACI|nr:6-phospho-beta-glucosidase [Metabacillus halosaccharovorans]MCV9884097.1 6-phospho-beta-glucosidase [Metabacillus halosaccharovorans]
MRKKLKVAVIGGGSSYTPELIEGFIKRYQEFPIDELYLVDIEAGREKLKTVGALAVRMIEKAGLPIELHMTFDRREAIKDAAFVTTQIRVGMLDARSRDEKIPLRYGLLGQETTGAGGFAKALRTIPVILDICKDIEEVSPHAFLLNFTNPAGIVTEAVTKYTKVKTIGLCNLPIGTKMLVAKMLGVDVSKVEIEMAGINHLNWTTKVWVEGIEKTGEVLDIISGVKGVSVKNIPDIEWEREFIQSVGMIPCSYLRYYYMKDKMLEKQLQDLETKGTRADEVKKVEEELFALYQDPFLNRKPPQLEKRGGAYYSEAAVNLMTSIYNNKKDIQIVNVKNNGILSCLPDDVSVEVNCVIDSEGATPLQLKTAALPPHIRGLLQVVKAYEELTVEAAVHGDYQAGMQALTIHPLIGSAELAKRVFSDILNGNKEFLPQFSRYKD